MSKVIIHNSVTVNGAFEAPSHEEWLELDADSADGSLQQLVLADALLLGRKTYRGWRPSGRISVRIRRWATWRSGSTACRSTSPRGPSPGRWNGTPPSLRVRSLRRPRAQGQARGQPDRLRMRGAGAHPRPAGSGRRVLVLGESAPLAGRAADRRRSRPDPPAAGRGHALSIRSRLAALPACRGLRERITGSDHVRRRIGRPPVARVLPRTKSG